MAAAGERHISTQTPAFNYLSIVPWAVSGSNTRQLLGIELMEGISRWGSPPGVVWLATPDPVNAQIERVSAANEQKKKLPVLIPMQPGCGPLNRYPGTEYFVTENEATRIFGSELPFLVILPPNYP